MGTIARGTKAGGGTNLNSGQTADPAEVNTDFNTIYTEFNGNIANANVLAAAAIAMSKLANIGARVYNSANISIADATATALTFDSERYDTDGFHSVATNTDRLTVPTGMAGQYLIVGHVVIVAGADYSSVGLQIYLNGATIINNIEMSPSTFSTNPVLTVATIYDLAAADYVTLRVYQDNTANAARNVLLSANQSPEFAIAILGT